MKIQYSELKSLEISFAEIDRLWEEDIKKSKAVLTEIQKKEQIKALENDEQVSKKKMTQQQIEQYAAEHGQLRKYIAERVFPSQKSGMFIVENGELTLKNDKTFLSKYGAKIKAKSLQVYKNAVDDCEKLYTPEVFSRSWVIDEEKGDINLMRKTNYNYAPDFNKGKEDGDELLNFIFEVICASDQAQYEFILDWLAYVSRRKKTNVVMFLTALGGTGKSFFCDLLSELFGSAFVETSEAVLSGEEKFNVNLRGASIARLEETSGTANYSKLMRGVKQLSTAAKLTVREMYADPYDVTNIVNFIILSNHFRDIPVGDRRMYVPDIDNKYQNNIKYFDKLSKHATQDALQYIFNMLYTRKTPDFLLAPETSSKQDYKEVHMNSAVKFILCTYMIQNPKDEQKASTSHLWKEYVTFCSAVKLPCQKKDLFFNTVKQYVPFVRNADGTPKTINGYHWFQLNFDTLYNNIIVRSKEITPQRFEQMKQEFNEDSLSECESEVEREDELDDVFDLKKKKPAEDENLKKIIENQNSLIEQLKQQLQEITTKYEQCKNERTQNYTKKAAKKSDGAVSKKDVQMLKDAFGI